MMRRTVVSLLALAILVAVGPVTFAGDGDKAAAKTTSAKAEAKPEAVKGKLVCLGCTLKKSAGANAQCGKFGCKHALKTADGKLWTLLENDKSRQLIAGEGFHNKDITITATKLANAQALDVESFEVDGKAYHYCKHEKCQAMGPSHKH